MLHKSEERNDGLSPHNSKWKTEDSKNIVKLVKVQENVLDHLIYVKGCPCRVIKAKHPINALMLQMHFVRMIRQFLQPIIILLCIIEDINKNPL